MYIPASEITVCYAENLKGGDFARLHEMGNQFVFVVQAGDDLIALLLEDRDKGNYTKVRELHGVATRIEGSFFEVDYATSEVAPNAIQVGTLEIRKGNLCFVALNPRGSLIYFPIAMSEGSEGHQSVRFTTWRVVKKVRDEIVTLVERSAD